MNKKIAVGFIIFLFTSLAFAGHVYPDAKVTAAEKGVWRITHYDPRVNYPRLNSQIPLTSPELVPFKGTGRGGYPPFWPSGYAYVRSTGSSGYPKSSIKITTKDIPSSFECKCYFEVWTIDDDTNYAQSHGVFYTAMGGAGAHRYTFNNYLGIYDRVVITQESFYDTNPQPGKIILEGAIPPSTYYNVQPKQTVMMTDVIKNYS